MLKGYFSYIRVSTQRQGVQGTSLTEQTAAIDRYARSWDLRIIKRFEERETAAKTGRPVFLDMVKSLKRGKAQGVIIHKIDRSARNLRDWVELNSLVDLGIEVHFANEGLDLRSRGGRLSADIQAVVASDYIRNLREETIKGMHGRIKQGFYPFPAPIGYVDSGAAKPKELDPVRGPLIKKAFELYATGRYSVLALAAEMYDHGLRARSGQKFSKNALNVCLRNPFYIGLVRLRSMSETFLGKHLPLVSKRLFDDVQAVLSGKSVKKRIKHFFIFRRLVTCGSCRNRLVAERQKGIVYYRCHTRDCGQSPFRETRIIEEFYDVLSRIEFTKAEITDFEVEIRRLENDGPKEAERTKQELALMIKRVEARLEKLADAYIDGIFDRETYDKKQQTLISERLRASERMAGLDAEPEKIAGSLRSFLELAKSACLSFKRASDEEKRELVEIICSNILANGKSLIFELNSEFQAAHDRPSGLSGAPFRDTSRTLAELLKVFKKNPTSVFTSKTPDILDQTPRKFIPQRPNNPN